MHNMRPGMFAGQIGDGKWRYPFLFTVPMMKSQPVVSDDEADETLNSLKSLDVDAVEFSKWSAVPRIEVVDVDGNARQFSENDLYLYRQYLVDNSYADKTIQGAIIVAKQLFKWAWRQGMLQQYRLEAASFPKAKAAPQPCFTTEQVDILINAAAGNEKLAFALMGYAGLRIGEVEQLLRKDIIVKNHQFTMIHVCRGGSNGTTKDRDDRFVPIHPKIAELLSQARASNDVMLPDIDARSLLKRLKVLCGECKFKNPKKYKLHSFRHHFASMCANHGVAHRKALAWLGHSNSDMLDLYYHLHDDDSQRTMMELARSDNSESGNDGSEDSLRTVGVSKIVKNPQIPELQELTDIILEDFQKPERVGLINHIFCNYLQLQYLFFKV